MEYELIKGWRLNKIEIMSVEEIEEQIQKMEKELIGLQADWQLDRADFLSKLLKETKFYLKEMLKNGKNIV